MNFRKVLAIVGVLGMVAGFGVQEAEAQVAAGDGSAFIGKWQLNLEVPAGGFGGGAGGQIPAPVVEITDGNGQLAATVTGGMGGAQRVSSISKSGETLVLSYSRDMGGQSIPLTVRLTPSGDAMKAELSFAGQMSLTGTAVKQ